MMMSYGPSMALNGPQPRLVFCFRNYRDNRAVRTLSRTKDVNVDCVCIYVCIYIDPGFRIRIEFVTSPCGGQVYLSSGGLWKTLPGKKAVRNPLATPQVVRALQGALLQMRPLRV